MQTIIVFTKSYVIIDFLWFLHYNIRYHFLCQGLVIWQDKSIDTETTGKSPFRGRHRVIEIALVEIVNNKLTGKYYQTYLNPEGRKNTSKALKIHHLKDSFLTDKPLFKDQLPEILKFIGKSELIFQQRF